MALLDNHISRRHVPCQRASRTVARLRHMYISGRTRRWDALHHCARAVVSAGGRRQTPWPAHHTHAARCCVARACCLPLPLGINDYSRCRLFLYDAPCSPPRAGRGACSAQPRETFIILWTGRKPSMAGAHPSRRPFRRRAGQPGRGLTAKPVATLKGYCSLGPSTYNKEARAAAP